MSTEEFSDTDWGHRRRGLRHAVAIPASILGSVNAQIGCEIRNLSSTGLFIRYDLAVSDEEQDPLKIGTRLRVSFAPDITNAPEQTITVVAEVMRRMPEGVGVRFRDIDKEQMAALRMAAASAVAGRYPGVGNVRADEPPGGGQLGRGKGNALRDCRRVTERHLPKIISTLIAELSKALRHAGNHATELEILDAKSVSIGRSIERHVLMRFAELGGLLSTQEMYAFVQPEAASESQQPAPDPSALDAVAERMEAGLGDKSDLINHRFEAVLGRAVKREENPLGPGSMCRTLWHIITEYCDTPAVRSGLSKAMRSGITPRLYELYEDLNSVLDDHDVPANKAP